MVSLFDIFLWHINNFNPTYLCSNRLGTVTHVFLQFRLGVHGQKSSPGRCQVEQNRRYHLLAGPQLPRLHNGRRLGRDGPPTHVTPESNVQQLAVLFPGQKLSTYRQTHAGYDVVLNEAAQRRPVLGHQVLLANVGDELGLAPGLVVLREVDVHLVAVEVGVVGLAVGVVEAERVPGRREDADLVRHDGGAVERGLTVDEDDVAARHVPVDKEIVV